MSGGKKKEVKGMLTGLTAETLVTNTNACVCAAGGTSTLLCSFDRYGMEPDRKRRHMGENDLFTERTS